MCWECGILRRVLHNLSKNSSIFVKYLPFFSRFFGRVALKNQLQSLQDLFFAAAGPAGLAKAGSCDSPFLSLLMRINFPDPTSKC
jgi:hypothetical protein